MTDELQVFIRERCVPINAGNNVQISLQKPQKIWWLEEGAVNVYFFRREGENLGQRTLLAHFSAPCLLFSWEVDSQTFPFAIEAVSEGQSLFYELNAELLRSQKFAAHLDRWIHAFDDFFQYGISDKEFHFLPSKGTASFTKDAFYQSSRAATPGDKEKIVWLSLVEGQMQVLGMPALTLEKGDLFPLAYDMWLQAKETGAAEIISTHALIEKGLWQKALRIFHEFFSSYFIIMQQKALQNEVERLQEKQEKDAQVLHHTFMEMVALLNPEETPPSSVSLNPLYLASQEIGKNMNIQMVAPETFVTLGTIKDDVEQICQASQIRYRQIQLKGKWWEHDSAHILGFRGPDNQPVALINSKPGRFDLFDPQTRTKQKVTEEIAKQISATAFVFYRPFPDDLKTGKDVLAFCSKRHWKVYVSLTVYGMVASLLSLLPPMVISILYSKVIPDANLPLLFQLVFLLAVAAISSTLFIFFRSLILVRFEGVVNNEVQAAFWDRLFKLPASFFRKYSSGDLFFRLYSVEEIRTLLSARGIRLILTGIFSFFYFIAMAIYSFKLTLVALGLVAVVGVITTIASIFKIRLERVVLGLKAKLNGILTQIIGAIAKIRTAGSETRAFSFWAASFSRRKKLEMQAQTIQNSVVIANAVLPLLSLIFIFILAISLERADELEIWAFLAFDAAFVPFSIALFDLSNTLLEMTTVLPQWEKAKVIIEEPLEINNQKIDPGRLKGEISFDRIVFQYEKDRPVLRDVSFQVAPGEFIGIVGHSSCGKSTLLRLLLGFETPLSGAVFYDGKDLSTLNVNEVRKQLGVVLQGTGLIAGSIYENLVCGAHYPREDLERAIELSGFKQDLESFPMGLHTFITSGGETFSGGQKQRLLIARALIAKPRILIFDEATNALDNKTQDIVSSNLDALEVTRIVVAHRLSTLKKADRIYVIDRGQIVQSGTFATLAKKEGLFKEMLLRQAL